MKLSLYFSFRGSISKKCNTNVEDFMCLTIEENLKDRVSDAIYRDIENKVNDVTSYEMEQNLYYCLRRLINSRVIL